MNDVDISSSKGSKLNPVAHAFSPPPGPAPPRATHAYRVSSFETAFQPLPTPHAHEPAALYRSLHKRDNDGKLIDTVAAVCVFHPAPLRLYIAIQIRYLGQPRK